MDKQIQKVALNLVRINENNPRVMQDDKIEQLIDSLLTFPKMMYLRPITLNDDFIALGGNMRTIALNKIQELGWSAAKERIEANANYQRKPEHIQQQIVEFWEAWYKKPFAVTQTAENLTDEEKQEFIIKDNVSFGKWDWDALANEWDNDMLQEWGMDVWGDDGKDWNNLDYIDEEQKDPSLDKPIKIEVVLSKDNEEQENEIRTAIKEAIQNFVGCEIK